jgi:hypothetical protein
MNKQNSTLKKAMLEALEKSLGIVTTACKKVGIDRGSHYNWMKDDIEYNKAVRDIENITLDFAESQLHKQIQDNNTSATIFYLKCRGKARGYTEKLELSTEDDSAIKIQIIDARTTN